MLIYYTYKQKNKTTFRKVDTADLWSGASSKDLRSFGTRKSFHDFVSNESEIHLEPEFHGNSVLSD